MVIIKHYLRIVHKISYPYLCPFRLIIFLKQGVFAKYYALLFHISMTNVWNTQPLTHTHNEEHVYIKKKERETPENKCHKNVTLYGQMKGTMCSNVN